MAQRLVTTNVNTVIPGAYPTTTVRSTPTGVGATGDVLIIGEAAGGEDFTAEANLKENFFFSNQLSRITAKYLRGPVVDAARALVSPSNDTDIQGASGRIGVIKTNQGTKANRDVPAVPSGTYGELRDKNFGSDGNKYAYRITDVEDELGPMIQGDELTIGDGSIFNGLSFDVRNNGLAETTITLSANETDHDTITKLADEIDGQLPSGLECVPADGVDAIVIRAEIDADAKANGWGKSFELIDSTPGDLATLGLDAQLVVSSQEPIVELSITRTDTNVEETLDAEAEIALRIGYQGTTATIEISGGQLTTTVTGGTGNDLSIDLSEYTTLGDLAEFIDSQDGYTASAVEASLFSRTDILDEVSGIGIASTEEDLTPGRIKRAKRNFENAAALSLVLDFEAQAEAGLPAATGRRFLAGGSRGATTGATIIAALDAIRALDANFVVPLFSRDASEDIAEGSTDSASTYTIDAINFATKSHVLAMSTTKKKKHRIALLSKWATYSEQKSHAKVLGSFRTILMSQRTSQVDGAGTVVSHLPWHTACIAAGMQSAGFYRSLTHKYANVVSVEDPSGFDSGDIGDLEDAIESGLMVLETDDAGIRWVVDQTTYGFDDNFVYNSLQAVYMADVLALSLADSMERRFVGKSLADVDVATALSFVDQIMRQFRTLKIITGSDDAPLGYRGVNISIEGPVMSLSLEVKLATAILFIPIDVEISRVERSGEAA